MIDAINKEFLDKNSGIAANMSMVEMERVRRDAHTNFRQTIGTAILDFRRKGRSAENRRQRPLRNKKTRHRRLCPVCQPTTTMMEYPMQLQ